MTKNNDKTETLEQYDFPWSEDEYIFANKSEYAEAIGDFLISFSNLESALNLLVVEMVNDRSHDLGYKVIKSLGYANKINLARDLYLPTIHHIPNNKIRERRKNEFEIILKKLNQLGESRNKIAHANWVTLDKNGYVRTKIKSDETGTVQFIRIKITSSIMKKWSGQCDQNASKVYKFKEKVLSSMRISVPQVVNI